jgi:hypothetical protein
VAKTGCGLDSRIYGNNKNNKLIYQTAGIFDNMKLKYFVLLSKQIIFCA